jgi:hypothetical protein
VSLTLSPFPESLGENLPKSFGVNKNPQSAATGQPILGKSKREKAGKQNTTRATMEKWKNKRAQRGMGLKVAGEYNIEARREDLQIELKKLFHKE